MAEAKQEQSEARVGIGRRHVMTLLALMVAVPLAVIYALPTVLLLVVGMLPTLVAMLTDRSGQRFAGRCVGTLNFCGVIPAMTDLWTGIHTLDGLLDTLMNVYVWLFMYGAAAIGWMLYYSISPVVNVVLTIRAEREIVRLRSRLTQLEKLWGPGVTRHVKDAPVQEPARGSRQ